ncbi:MAG TPA: glycosyltransferase [Ignavibacteriales bacterium]|nr:glycosyltransferase [Ignavibacteriales bacterium]HOL82370.1 glycosyltransferase [Ignavibacteriales bacterium]HOM66238.1 glycosyltransferase [Ignavibacteriales bacterium]HPP34381.1 glycosyltransferase [Ignavibacteriales bacterium]HRR19492.1 glycosyltransferase [Ignavibacteriales bacterium]
MLKVLVISYFWPPAVRASMHWQFDMVRYFRNYNIEPIVLTVENETFDTKRDYSLLKNFPSDIKVIKTYSWEPFNLYRKVNKIDKDKQLVSSETISLKNKSLMHRFSIWIRMNLFIPDARLGWYPYAVSKMKKYLQKNKIDAIVSIGPPHSSHLIAMSLSKNFKIPFYPVFEDPWLDIVYYKNFKRSKITLAIDGKFEKSVLEQATNVIFVTKSMEEDYHNKYDFVKNKSYVLYWGYNEDVFNDIKYPFKPDGEFWIVHTGNLFDYQNPAKFWEVINKKINDGMNIKLKFSGTISPVIYDELKKNNLLERTDLLGYIPYNEMLGYICSSDLLLVCPTEKRHVPGKLFEYLRSGKPIIAFGNDNKEVNDILQYCKAGRLYSYDDITENIFDELRKYNTDLGKVKKFNRSSICENFSSILKSQNTKKNI